MSYAGTISAIFLHAPLGLGETGAVWAVSPGRTLLWPIVSGSVKGPWKGANCPKMPERLFGPFEGLGPGVLDFGQNQQVSASPSARDCLDQWRRTAPATTGGAFSTWSPCTKGGRRQSRGRGQGECRNEAGQAAATDARAGEAGGPSRANASPAPTEKISGP